MSTINKNDSFINHVNWKYNISPLYKLNQAKKLNYFIVEEKHEYSITDKKQEIKTRWNQLELD